MKLRPLVLSYVFLAFFSFCTPALADVYLEANFNNKRVGIPIGTGGAELGEPIEVGAAIIATVEADPMPTPFLQIQDNDDYYAGSATFEFLGNVEVTTGFVEVCANLWFPEYEQFHLRIREQGGYSEVFTNLDFTSSGFVYCSDAAGNVGNIGTYETGRHFPVRIAHNLDAGFYTVYLDGAVVLSMRYHGVVGHGIGRVLFGCANDADYDGLMYVDDLFVADYPAPKYYLRANFNYKTVDAPIGTGGAEIGEPVSVDPSITAIVRDAPMLTPSLEIEDDADYSAGYARFEFIGSEEVVSGLLVAEAHLWFDVFDDYWIRIREQGSATAKFSDLYFSPTGRILVEDAGGAVDGEGTYELDRVVMVRIIHNLDAGTYRVIIDGTEIVTNEPHDVVGHGIGRLYFGCHHDADYTGRFYVDNIQVAQVTQPRPAACCMDAVCVLALPIDCAYVEGEFQAGVWSCNPNPCVPSGIPDGVGIHGTSLLPAIPNPIGDVAALRYHLEQPGPAQVIVTDAAGRVVRRLLSAESPAGPGGVEWDRRNDRGALVSPGVYFGCLVTGDGVVSRRMIVLE
jgi:hypothetical protein